MIEVQNVSKTFKIYRREQGFFKQVRSLVYRNYNIKQAVKDINFSIEKGELVGYIGRNGAGKSTTIKMLSGILTPSEGSIKVDGMVPYENRKENAMKIGVVFGQRSQLYWDLPMDDTFSLYKKIYKIDDRRFKKNVDFFVELLDMEEFLHQPIRQLSLGQKMRANIAVALLHDPQIVYLDEPTIGLDIIAKSKIRQFIREVNTEKETTIILTTHDMDDIEQICDRLIMIDGGQILFDGTLNNFKKIYSGELMLTVEFVDEQKKEFDYRLKVIKKEGPKYTILFNKDKISVGEAISLITRKYHVLDLQMKESDIEEIVKDIYNQQT